MKWELIEMWNLFYWKHSFWNRKIYENEEENILTTKLIQMLCTKELLMQQIIYNEISKLIIYEKQIIH